MLCRMVSFPKKVYCACASAIVAASALGACTNSARDSSVTTEVTPTTVAQTSGAVILKNSKGENSGSVTIHPVPHEHRVEVVITVSHMTPGFHGVHIHNHGVCTPDADDPKQNFVSAGGHLQLAGNHSNHLSGELSNILVNSDGTGRSVQTTDAFSLYDLSSGRGTAIIIHDKPSNFANIPDRYTHKGGHTGADKASVMTSDAGNRILCGVISSGVNK